MTDPGNARAKREMILAAAAVVLLFAIGGALGWIIRPMHETPPPPPCPDEYWPTHTESQLPEEAGTTSGELLKRICNFALAAATDTVNKPTPEDLVEIQKVIARAVLCASMDALNHSAQEQIDHIIAVDKAYKYAKSKEWANCATYLAANSAATTGVNHPH